MALAGSSISAFELGLSDGMVISHFVFVKNSLYYFHSVRDLPTEHSDPVEISPTGSLLLLDLLGDCCDCGANLSQQITGDWNVAGRC
jgi:hypothetical protein